MRAYRNEKPSEPVRRKVDDKVMKNCLKIVIRRSFLLFSQFFFNRGRRHYCKNCLLDFLKSIICKFASSWQKSCSHIASYANATHFFSPFAHEFWLCRFFRGFSLLILFPNLPAGSLPFSNMIVATIHIDSLLLMKI